MTLGAMGSYLHRYRTDGSEPTKRAFARDVIVRGLLPALVLLGAVVLFATFLLPFGGIGAEAEVNQVLQEGRTPALDLAAATVSHLAGVVGAPLTAIIAFFVLRRRTGQWWLALVPLVSVALEALVYQTAALLVGRRRPEGVEQMDWGLPHARGPGGDHGGPRRLAGPRGHLTALPRHALHQRHRRRRDHRCPERPDRLVMRRDA